MLRVNNDVSSKTEEDYPIASTTPSLAETNTKITMQ